MMDYSKVKKHWEKTGVKVHSKMSGPHLDYFTALILKELEPSGTDKVLDIGCGDGAIDEMIKHSVAELHGFDFSEYLLTQAINRNRDCQYWQQSFLKTFEHSGFDKAFSYSTFQYCHPRDAEILLENTAKCLTINGKAAHLDIPDESKMKFYYFRSHKPALLLRGFLIFLLQKASRLLNFHVHLWSDGSYWHNMKVLGGICERLNLKYEIRDAISKYRSHLIIRK